MNSIPHPSHWLDTLDIDLISKETDKAEKMGMLTATQLEIIYRNQWFKMFMPENCGGLGLTLPEVLRIEEGISWVDGSMGWVVTLCSGAGWFVGFLKSQTVDEFCKEENVCFAGSGAVSGTAEETAEGYQVTGSWKYASGALHATAFTANCALTKNGKQLYLPDGSPLIKAFIFKKEEVTIQKTWNSMGMKATGSHSFEVKSLNVKRERAFVIDSNPNIPDDPIYQYPFLQLAETTLAMNISGMASRFIDLCEETFNYAPESQSSKLISLAIEIRKKLNNVRQDFYTEVDHSWSTLVSKGKIAQKDLIKISEVSHRLVRISRAELNELYPHIGLRSAGTDTEINRVWRNFNTAILHGLFSNVLI